MDSSEAWLKIEEATKDYNFDELKSVFGDLPEAKTLESVKSLKGLMKSYIDTSRMVGDKSKRLPDNDADWEQFWQSRGKPSDPSGYQFDLPEYQLPDDIYDYVGKNLHEANLTNEQANKVMKTFLNLTKEDADKREAEYAKSLEEFTKQKEVRFGDKLSEYDNLAKSYIDQLGDGVVKSSLETLMANPDGLEFLANLAQAGNENPGGPEYRQPSRNTAKTASEQLEMLKRDKNFLDKLFGTDMRIPALERKRAKELWQSLHEQAVKEK